MFEQSEWTKPPGLLGIICEIKTTGPFGQSIVLNVDEIRRCRRDLEFRKKILKVRVDGLKRNLQDAIDLWIDQMEIKEPNFEIERWPDWPRGYTEVAPKLEDFKSR